jgi:hypothetical protein
MECVLSAVYAIVRRQCGIGMLRISPKLTHLLYEFCLLATE